jgi:hypothetical protein
MLRASLAPRPHGELAPRPAHRLSWFRAALAPLRKQLPERRFERLVHALCLCTGIESLVALKDVAGLDDDEALRVKLWAARELVEAALRR